MIHFGHNKLFLSFGVLMSKYVAQCCCFLFCFFFVFALLKFKLLLFYTFLFFCKSDDTR